MQTGYNVLLVEDSLADISLLKRAFFERAPSVTIHTVENAVQAFAYLSRQGSFNEQPLPDLILLDLNLPVIEGTRVLNIIKEHPAWKNICTIVLTSSTRRQDVQRCMQLGADAYVLKPPVWNKYLEFADTIRYSLTRDRRPQRMISAEFAVDQSMFTVRN
jgi:two-component system, chemotaxis family, response regulator Rcp1